MQQTQKFTQYKLQAKDVSGYKMNVRLSRNAVDDNPNSAGLYIDLKMVDTDGAVTTTRTMNYEFRSTLEQSLNLKNGSIEGQMGDFGTIEMDWKGTGDLKSKTCKGRTRQSRFGKFTGTFQFDADYKDADAFALVDETTWSGKAIRVDGGFACKPQGVPQVCAPENRLTDGAAGVFDRISILAGNTTYDGVTFTVSLRERPAPTREVDTWMRVSGLTPSNFTAELDASSAHVELDGVGSFSGDIDYTAPADPDAQVLECNDGDYPYRTSLGSYTSTVIAHDFGPHGDLAVPSVGENGPTTPQLRVSEDT